jgi:hypothetical protein
MDGPFPQQRCSCTVDEVDLGRAISRQAEWGGTGTYQAFVRRMGAAP